MILTDLVDQPFGEGDIIVYATSSGSSPVLTRAEVIEIQEWKKDYNHPYGARIRVRPERTHRWTSSKEFVWITKAPIILISRSTSFEEYREALLDKYEPIGPQEVQQIEA